VAAIVGRLRFGFESANWEMCVASEAMPLAQEMTPQQREEAREYGRAQLICNLLDKGLDLLYLSVMALLVARPLDAWLAAFIPRDVLRLIVLYLITIGLHECVSFGVAFYGGHVLEHRYGLSRQTFGAWLTRHLKHYGLAVVFGLAMFLALYGLMWYVGTYWWLAAAAAFFVVSIVLGQLAPVLILPLFYKIERLEDPTLSDRMTRLAAGTGLSIEGVYRMGLSDETSKANAMLAGLGRTRRVLMGDTLLEQFSPDEIDVIFAHEIGHHVHKHLPKMIATGLVFSVVGLWLCDRALALWLESQGVAYQASQMPVFALPMVMLLLILFSNLIEPLQNVISRRYERQCDRYALLRTKLPEAYRSAFRKLAVLNKDNPDPHPLEVFLFHSHPPISERVSAADR
jgi:STE24 endopeptidase